MAKRDQQGRAATPKLRFPEFRDAPGWKEIPLRSLAKPVTERLHTEDAHQVLTLSGERGIVLQSDYFGKRVAGNDAARYTKIVLNDFVYNDRTTQQSAYGTIKRLSMYDGGVVSPIYKCFRFNAGENHEFWEWYFASGTHDAALAGLVNEGARAGRFNISPERFLSTTVWRPSRAEQRRISDCLTTYDELLAAEGRKLEALQAYKSALMQQLFPVEGECRPRLRFPEFRGAGDWEEKRLDEVSDFQSGGTPSKNAPEFWSGSIPWVSAKDMKQMVLEDTQDHLSGAAVEDGAKVVPPGTVLILTRGMTLLKDIPICVVARPMALNQDVRALRPRKGFEGEFLAFMLVGKKQRLRGMVDIAGHGTGRLNTDRLKALALLFPRPAEQVRISACLRSLDALMTVASRKLEGLRVYRKGLMQQLFPSSEDN